MTRREKHCSTLAQRCSFAVKLSERQVHRTLKYGSGHIIITKFLLYIVHEYRIQHWRQHHYFKNTVLINIVRLVLGTRDNKHITFANDCMGTLKKMGDNHTVTELRYYSVQAWSLGQPPIPPHLVELPTSSASSLQKDCMG